MQDHKVILRGDQMRMSILYIQTLSVVEFYNRSTFPTYSHVEGNPYLPNKMP